jgi:hypothetical protein
MANVSLKIEGLTELRGDLGKLGRILNAENLVGKVAADARNIIQQRTLRGKDVEHNSFKPYSRKSIYIEKTHRPKPKGGEPTKGGKARFYEGGYRQFAAATKGSARPNLFASGAMFRAFQAMPKGRRRAEIGFTQRRQAIKAAENQETRPFIGIHRNIEEPKLQETFGKLLDRALRKAGF